MAGFSDYLENALLDHVLGGPAYTKPATIYIALYNAAPTDAGGGTPVSGTGYARIASTNDAANWPAAAGGVKANASVITFATAAGSWGVITHFAIFDAVTGGNMLGWGALSESKTVTTNDVVRFLAGALVVTLD